MLYQISVKPASAWLDLEPVEAQDGQAAIAQAKAAHPEHCQGRACWMAVPVVDRQGEGQVAYSITV